MQNDHACDQPHTSHRPPAHTHKHRHLINFYLYESTGFEQSLLKDIMYFWHNLHSYFPFSAEHHRGENKISRRQCLVLLTPNLPKRRQKQIQTQTQKLKPVSVCGCNVIGLTLRYGMLSAIKFSDLRMNP